MESFFNSAFSAILVNISLFFVFQVNVEANVTEYMEQGAATVIVSVAGNFNCNVYNVEFDDDPTGERSWTLGNIPQNNIAIIADADTSNEDGYYNVIVQDLTQSNTTIPCNPRITTKPPWLDSSFNYSNAEIQIPRVKRGFFD